MTNDEKIKWVREKVYELEKLKGVGVAEYPLMPVETEFGGDDIFAAILGRKSYDTPVQKVVVITADEQIDILRRLEKEKLITILNLHENGALLQVAPFHPSPIKIKTLENISRTLADKFTGTQIVDILLDYGIPRCDIPYPNTKWRTLTVLTNGIKHLMKCLRLLKKHKNASIRAHFRRNGAYFQRLVRTSS